MKKIRVFISAALCCALLVSAKAEASPKKRIALTFDDGPSGIVTGTLLEGLSKRRIHATFFLCGYRIEENPHYLKKMQSGGHEIGIHGVSHKYFTHMTSGVLEQEIDATDCAIYRLTGKHPALLRPPGGLYNDDVLKMAEEKNYPVILWSVDPEDWDPAQRCFTVERVVEQAKDGDIILLHDLSAENVQAALTIVDKLRAKDYQFCTVSQLAKLKAVPLIPGHIYAKIEKSQ